MQPMDHLRQLFGSQRAIANAMRLQVSTISMWNRNGIPLERRFELVELCRERGLPVDAELLLGDEVRRAVAQLEAAA